MSALRRVPLRNAQWASVVKLQLVVLLGVQTITRDRLCAAGTTTTPSGAGAGAGDSPDSTTGSGGIPSDGSTTTGASIDNALDDGAMVNNPTTMPLTVELVIRCLNVEQFINDPTVTTALQSVLIQTGSLGSLIVSNATIPLDGGFTIVEPSGAGNESSEANSTAPGSSEANSTAPGVSAAAATTAAPAAATTAAAAAATTAAAAAATTAAAAAATTAAATAATTSAAADATTATAAASRRLTGDDILADSYRAREGAAFPGDEALEEELSLRRLTNSLKGTVNVRTVLTVGQMTNCLVNDALRNTDLGQLSQRLEQQLASYEPQVTGLTAPDLPPCDIDDEFDNLAGIILIVLLLLMICACFAAWGICTLKGKKKAPERGEEDEEPGTSLTPKIFAFTPPDGTESGVCSYESHGHDGSSSRYEKKAKAAMATFDPLSGNHPAQIKMPDGQVYANAQEAEDALMAKSEVKGTVKFDSLNFRAVCADPKLKEHVETKCIGNIARASNIATRNVQVKLSEGSVKVDYTISLPSSSAAKMNSDILQSQAFAHSFKKPVESIPSIARCMVGTWSDPVLSRPTLTEKSKGAYSTEYKCKKAVQKAKFADRELKEDLKSTGSGLILCQSSEIGEDEWTVNADGEGMNKEGIILTLVRELITGECKWTDIFARLMDLETGEPKSKEAELKIRKIVKEARHAWTEGSHHTREFHEEEHDPHGKPQVAPGPVDELNTPFPVPGWTRIAHTVRGKGISLDLPKERIRKLAEGGTRVRIQKAGYPSEAVQSKRGAYPIANIARGEVIGFGRAGGLRRKDVDEVWTCFHHPYRCAILDRLWHDEIPKSGADTLFEKCIYDAKANVEGMEWKGSGPAFMSWGDHAAEVRLGNLEVFIDNVESQCLHVKVVSTKDKVEYRFNDNLARIATGNGINICMIDPNSEKIVAFWYEKDQPDANERIINLLNTYPDGTIVLVAVKGSGMEMLDDEAKEALWNCGSTLEAGVVGQGYALIGCKGGFALDERQGQEAAFPGASGFIQLCRGLGQEHNKALEKKPEPGSIKDTCKGKKMPVLFKGGGSMNHV